MVPCYEYMDGLSYVMMSVYLIVIFFGSFFYVNRKMFVKDINYVISSYKAIKITGFSTTTATTTTTSGIFSKYFTGKDKKNTEGEEVVLTVDTSVGQILRTENEELKEEEGIEFKEETKPEEEKEIEKENEVLIAAADIILDVRANEEEEEKQK